MTRQRKWQIKKKENGCCFICGAPAVNPSYCLFHAIKARERQRVKQGCKRRNNSMTYRLEKETA